MFLNSRMSILQARNLERVSLGLLIKKLLGTDTSQTKICVRKNGDIKRVLKIVKKPDLKILKLSEYCTYLVNNSHPNLVKFHDIYHDKVNLYVVLDYLPQGDIFHYIHHKKHLSETKIARILTQILPVLNLVHKTNQIIKNLKPSNLLVLKGLENGEQLEVMLSDVGLADLNGSGDPKKTDAMQFMAPE